jgi:outer membrane protein insertion porin family
MRFLLVAVLLSSVAQAAPKIEFVGNANVSSTQLRAAIDDPFLPDGTLVPAILERNLLVLSAYYWDRGYARVNVGAPVITPTTIRIPIEENERFTLGNLVIAGDASPRQRARHHDALQIRPGDIFSRTALAAERERLSRYYQERGYAYVNVLPLTKIDIAKQTIAVTFEIERGKQANVEAIDVLCPLVPAAAGVVTFGVGSRFDAAQLEASKRAIVAVGKLDPTTVVMSLTRGTTDELVVVNFECL